LQIQNTNENDQHLLTHYFKICVLFCRRKAWLPPFDLWPIFRSDSETCWP